MSWAQKVAGNHKYIAWQSLLHSRILYATAFLAQKSDMIQKTYAQFIGKSLQGLFNIKKCVNYEALTNLVLGMSASKMLKHMQKRSSERNIERRNHC